MSATVVAEPELDEAPPRKRRGLKTLLVVLVILAVAAGATWYLLFGGDDTDPSEIDGEIVSLEPMTTTVGEDALHHARVALAVVLSSGQDPEIVDPKAPLLKDALLRELSRMDGPEVRSADGSQALRVALTDEAKEIWGEETIRRVVLTELLIN